MAIEQNCFHPFHFSHTAGTRSYPTGVAGTGKRLGVAAASAVCDAAALVPRVLVGWDAQQACASPLSTGQQRDGALLRRGVIGAGIDAGLIAVTYAGAGCGAMVGVLTCALGVIVGVGAGDWVKKSALTFARIGFYTTCVALLPLHLGRLLAQRGITAVETVVVWLLGGVTGAAGQAVDLCWPGPPRSRRDHGLSPTLQEMLKNANASVGSPTEASLGAAAFVLAQDLVARGLHAEAIPHYRDAIRLSANEARFYNKLGGALRHVNQHEEAVVMRQVAVSMEPGNAEFQHALGFTLYHSGRAEESLEHLREAVRLNSWDAWHCFCLGQALEHLGLDNEASVQLQAAARLGSLPEDTTALLNALQARIAAKAPAPPSNHRVAELVRGWARLSYPPLEAPVTHPEHWGMTPEQCALLELFSEKLSRTSDYQDLAGRPALIQRVLRMFEQMERFAAARPRIFMQLEQALDACGDRTAMALVEVEEVLAVHHALQAANPRAALEALGVTLIATEVARRHAAAYVVRHRMSGEHVEAYLLYDMIVRRGLNLPPAAHAMLYGGMIAVSSAERRNVINEARAAVCANSPQSIAWFDNWEPWQTYVRNSQSAPAFNTLRTRAVSQQDFAAATCPFLFAPLAETNEPVVLVENGRASYFDYTSFIEWWRQSGTHPVNKNRIANLNNLYRVVVTR